MAAAPPPWKQYIPHHLAQARHNFRLYQKLKGEGEFLDWAVTALFYAALHLVQACLIDIASDAFDYPRSHEQRDSFIRRKLGDVWLPYNFLQNQSTRARYHPDQPKPSLDRLQQYEGDHFAMILAALERRGTRLPGGR
jgi:hypothetical protein